MQHRAGAWERLPYEMKQYAQWAVAGASKAPMALDSSGKLRNVSVTRPSEWMTFDAAVALCTANAHTVTTHVTNEGVEVTKTGFDLGFILTESDPFTCIDLDVKDASTHPGKPEVWASPDDFDRYIQIVKTFNTYTERSRSGKGLHLWALGNIGRGYRRGGVEVYSQERFIICTGDVWIPQPVMDRQSVLSMMITQMRAQAVTFVLEEHEAKEDDWAVLETAYRASNADKFIELWKGDWQGLGYPSQSEADLSLMSMLAFYSDSNDQCRRMFRDSGLGKREKAVRDNKYLNYTLKTIRYRQERENSVEMSAILYAADQKMLAAQAMQERQGGIPAAAGALGAEHSRVIAPLAVAPAQEPAYVAPPVDAALAQLEPVSEAAVLAGQDGIPWPPGFVGTLAQFVYSNSWLQVKEVSIVAALGLMAGICGKAWHIPQSGLNLYIILVARSAVGKEAMHTGISTIVKAVGKESAQFGNFVDFNEYASGPALVKACLANPSVVNVSGEWGRRLKRLAHDERSDGPLQTLRTQMTNLYQKSGPQSIAGGISYSSGENNVASVNGVAYSMIGETTPETFYQSLTESMMEDGFLSRFLVVAYDGDRPDENHEIVTEPSPTLVKHLKEMGEAAFRRNLKNESQPVDRRADAAAILKAFSQEMSNNIRNSNEENQRFIWNRANLKVLRISALLAIGDNPVYPVVEKEHVEWAIALVRKDIGMMQRRVLEGDVGSGDGSRLKKLVALLREYRDAPELGKAYKINENMRGNSIVTRSYLHQRAQNNAVFYNHKLGLKAGLDQTIQMAIDNGYIMEVKTDRMMEMYNTHSKAYRILELPLR